MTRFYPVDDPSRVGEIRRSTAAMACEEGLEESLGANALLVVTEISTNLVKHAQKGEVFLSTLSDRLEPGIEILAIDRGPGITEVSRCFADGYSSAATAGTGLGAIARLSQEFDIYSEPGRGTVLVARIVRPGAPRTTVGVAIKPITGEEVCGDAWAFSKGENETSLIVADGLGHGILAACASEEAIAAFRRVPDLAPASALKQVHGSLRGTRGAAVAVVHVDRLASVIRYSGLGNISGVLIGSGKPTMMISHNGTAGHQSPRLQEFSYSLNGQALIVMHSDGVHSGWNLDDYPGLRRRDPSLIAGVLYRDAARSRDDICVVVARTGDAAA